jgi:hypothetical protein
VNGLGPDFRAEVQAYINSRGQEAQSRPRALEFIEGWSSLLREPRWIVAVFLLASMVAGLVEIMPSRRPDMGVRRTMLSLDTFDPLAPHTPERLLVSEFSKHE